MDDIQQQGHVVRRFEPFFSDSHHFEFDARIGVSPFYFYDPLGRILAILYADRTWEKVLFSPWRQENWDVNDTALIEDPRSDMDTADFFRRVAESHYLPSWCGERRTGALGPAEQAAAAKTEMHAATPAVSHIDSLGRIFLTIAHNRFTRSEAPSDPPKEEFYASRVEFDFEGNALSVIDAKDRLIVHYAYDLLGNRIHQSSMEAGERWTLTNVFRNIISTWDSRNHQFRATYDFKHRRVGTFLREGSAAEKLIVRTIYGESNANPELTNQRGNVVRMFDQSGLLNTEEYDFNGNLLTSERQLASEYKEVLDWSTTPLVESKIYASESRFDALNRPVRVTTPDGSIYRPTFNEGNFLESVNVNLRGAQVATSFVTNIEYNARGQRTLIEYENGAQTSYIYDKKTFRLISLLTRSSNTQLQSFHYTYDPNGNITHIQDAAQQTIYFNNQVVTADCDYAYDAVYRLIHAEGREHVGQATQPQTTSMSTMQRADACARSQNGKMGPVKMNAYTPKGSKFFANMMALETA